MSIAVSIAGTYDTPTVDFNPRKGVFSITGRSLPSNSFDFYAPILENIRLYLEKPADETVFSFKMDFISSSSTKIFQDIFFSLEQAHEKKHKVKVCWYYKFGDDDMKDLGDDLRVDTTFPFEFIAFE